MATLTSLDGFEHQTVDQSGWSFATTSNLYQNIATTGVSFVSGRIAGYAIRLAETGAAACRVQQQISGNSSSSTVVLSYYFKINTLPSGTSQMAFFLDTGSTLMADIAVDTTGHIVARLGSGGTTTQTTSGTYNDSSWHRIDLKLVTSGTTWTLDWQVDGSAQTQVSEAGHSNTAVFYRGFGSRVTTGTLSVDIDDCVESVTSGDYPLGEYRVYGSLPDSDGTHSVGSSGLAKSTGGTTNVWDVIDDWPNSGTDDYLLQADGETQIAGTGSNYLEWGFANTVGGGNIEVVRAVFSSNSAGTAANNVTLRIVDSGGTTLTDLIVSQDISATTKQYNCGLISAPGGTWDNTKFNGIKGRFGFSTDSNPDPYLQGIILEYAVKPSGTTVTKTYNINANIRGQKATSVDANIGGGVTTRTKTYSINVTIRGQKFSFIDAYKTSGGGGVTRTKTHSIDLYLKNTKAKMYRSNAWYEKTLPTTAPIHTNNTNYLLELQGAYGGAETNGTLAGDPQADNTANLLASTTLNGAITAGATSMVVSSATGFPATPFRAVIDDGSPGSATEESVLVTNKSGTTFTITRYTGATSHSNGATVKHFEKYLAFTGGVTGDLGTFDSPIYRVTPSDPLTFVYPKDEAPDYPGTWSGFVGYIHERFRPTGHLIGALEGTNEGIRIPTAMRDFFDVTQVSNADSPAVFYVSPQADPQGVGYYASFAELRYYPSQNKWYAQGSGITVLGTYGLTSDTNNSTTKTKPSTWPSTMTTGFYGGLTGVDPSTYQDNNENGGIRGNNAMSRTADYFRTIGNGTIPYAMEFFAERTRHDGSVYVFPFHGGENNKGGLIPEGTRLRLKPSIDVDAEVDANFIDTQTVNGYVVTPQRRAEIKAILKGLQQYGMIVGDNSGSGARIRLEALQKEIIPGTSTGRPERWEAHESDLKFWPFSTSWEFIADAYDPPLVEYTKTHSVDYLTKASATTKTITYSIQSLLKKTLAIVQSVDYLNKQTQAKAYSVDRFLLKTQTKVSSVDVVVRGQKYSFVDALKVNANTVFITYTIQHLLKQTISISYNTDSSLKKTLTKSSNIDIVVRGQKYHLVEAYKTTAAGTYTITYTVDTLLKKKLTLSQSIDVFAVKTAMKVSSFDVNTLLRLTKSSSIDTYLKGTLKNNHYVITDIGTQAFFAVLPYSGGVLRNMKIAYPGITEKIYTLATTPITSTAADSQAIPAVLWRPSKLTSLGYLSTVVPTNFDPTTGAYSAETSMVPSGQLPTIVFVDGSYSVDYDVINGRAELIWLHKVIRCGYNVLLINARGSGGYGRAFAEKYSIAHNEVNDIEAAVTWIKTQTSFVDPNRVMVLGKGRGGINVTTLAHISPTIAKIFGSISSSPHIGGDIMRWTDANSIAKNMIVNSFGGSPVDVPTEYTAKMLSHNVSSVQKEILFVHGEKDSRYDIKNIYGVHTALNNAGKNVTTMAFKTLGSDITDDSNQYKLGQPFSSKHMLHLMEYLDEKL